MNKRINFEDNIYIVLARIKMIQDLLALDTDPELFLDKTLEDIDFIDATLQAFQIQMKENLRLIEHEELLDHLSELEFQFSRALSEFLNSEWTISAQKYPAIRDKMSILRTRSLDRRKTAEIASAATGDFSMAPVVSSDELNELLKDF
jgi:hypothetical protein